MSRGLGKTESRIIDYLDEKARIAKSTELKTIQSYASTAELAEKLKIASDSVCQAISSLVKNERIRVYPNGRRRNRYFGSLILPCVNPEEISRKVQSILSTN